VNEKYRRAKELSKEKLELSKSKIDAAEDDVRKLFKNLEDASCHNSSHDAS
jgi:hypothetical protein